MHQLLIKHVKIYDGTGNQPFFSDVLIKDEKISKMQRDINPNSCEIIEGKEFALAPGFINVHSHSDLEIFRNKSMFHTIRQGITTELVGQDGSSVFPVTDEIFTELADNMAPLAGVLDREYWWRSCSDYINEAKKASLSVRIESLVGHGTIRMIAMGNENRRPKISELEKMKELVANSLKEGAKGLSLGLIYPPGSYADTEELIDICKVVAKYDGIVMVHMRSEEDKLLESLNEMIKVAKESKVRLHISHLKALGYKNWGKVPEVLKKIERAMKAGVEIGFDQYPYDAACTGLKIIVPNWAYEGGERAFQKRLSDKDEYGKILIEVNNAIKNKGGADKILIATVSNKKNNWMTGKNLGFIANKVGLTPGQVALDLLKKEGPSVVAIYCSAMSPDDISYIMKSPLQTICTDGIISSHSHPRTYGSFPRVLGKYVRKLKIMQLEEAIRKMTMEPARRLRLWDRGLIREGMSADLVLFDPNKIIDKSNYLNPKLYPEGIKAVWVLGDLKFNDF